MSALPGEGEFSESARAARLVVLDAVRSDLLRSDRTRLHYDAELRKRAGRAPPSVPVPLPLLGGALSLLLEVRAEPVLVLGVAEAALKAGGLPAVVQRDVVLAAAMAHCAAARAAVARGEVAAGYDAFEAAAATLRGAGRPPLAPQLAAEVGEALEELQPARLLELLSGPLPSSDVSGEDDEDGAPERGKTAAAAARSAVVAQVAALLERSAAGKGQPLPADYAARALQQCTAAEAVSMLPWRAIAAKPGGRAARAFADVAPVGARALLAVGYRTRDVESVRVAAVLLNAPGARGAAPLAREVACAALLLGDADAALDALLAEEVRHSLQQSADASVAAKPAMGEVRAAGATGGGGLLPGLVTCAERWLAECALSAFRDGTGAAAPLAPYFSDARVTRVLEPAGGASTVGGSTAGDALIALRARVSGAAGWVADQLLPPGASSAGAHVSGESSAGAAAAPPRSPVPGLEFTGRLSGRQAASAEAEAPAAPSAEAHRASAGGAHVAAAAPSAAPEPAAAAAVVPDGAKRHAAAAFRAARDLGSAAAATGSVAARAARVGASRLLLGAAAGLLAGAAASALWRTLSSRSALATAPTATAAPGASALLTAREAETLVRAWQRAKAAAMGAEHAGGALAGVLTEPLLSEWRGRAEKAAAAAFHWDYTLRGVRVRRLVHTGGAGGPVAVEASLSERAELVDSRSGRLRDRYDTAYVVRYMLERGPDGVYRIARSAVLDSAPL